MGGAIGNEGFDIVFYLALMVPLEYLLTSRRVVADGNRRKAAMIAGGVLAAVSAVKLGLEMAHKAPSYYDKLEVMPTANHAEIKKGYRAAAQKVHPDKLQAAGEDEDGDEAFVELKKAYDVLTDSALRDLYQKFGPDGLEYQTDTSKLMAGLGFFYVVWITVAYLLTRRKSVGAAQTWTFTGLLALGIFEYQASIVGVDFAEEFLPQLALFRPARRHGPSARGLFWVGASTRPGNGVPLVLIGAQKVARDALASIDEAEADAAAAASAEQSDS